MISAYSIRKGHTVADEVRDEGLTLNSWIHRDADPPQILTWGDLIDVHS